MFHARVEDVGLLRDSISTISELIDETELHIGEKGIEMTSADRAVVVVVSFSLSKDAFSVYEFDGDMRIGINLVNMQQILRRANPNDVLDIRLDGKKLELTLQGDSVRRFILPLIDISKTETPDLKKLEDGFSSSFAMDSEILSSGIEDAELVTDSVVITVRKDNFSMKAESDSTSTQLDIQSGTDSLKIIDIGEPVRARYSLDYMKKIIKARKLAPEVRISMATDYPMKMQFEVPEKLRLGFILAPRVEE